MGRATSATGWGWSSELGVESAAQARVIQRLGNVYVQGYLYSRPQDVALMTAFLSEHHTERCIERSAAR